jgi:hypothetical protein
MNNDSDIIFEAYKNSLTESHCKWALQGCDCGECEECQNNAMKGEGSEEELGPDPKEVAEYDQAKKEISFDKYPFWDAYHAVKEGAWSEDDFHQWCQTVWNDGANEGNRPR